MKNIKTRDIIEHLEEYEELIDGVDFLSISISNLTCKYINVHCSPYEQSTLDLFKDYADEVAITKHGGNIKMSLDIDGVDYFIIVGSEEEVYSILKGE